MTSPEPQTQHVQHTTPPQATPQAEEAMGPETQQAPTEEHHGGRVVHLHTAHPRVPIPYVTPGDMFSGARTATATATSLLPSPRRLAFYGLLGGMTVAGAMAWPVAVAVGAATEVITREQSARHQQEHARMERERAEREQDREDTAGRSETGAPRQTAMG
ncbi:hypothetical protein ACQEV2_11450 [Streptomyces sp. CA-251387]|uniref:hypothetical protein n=1 Tax=Streptomyces sp. CA-251387 TaxID=3240064 RepID=UPI003D948EE1